MRAATLATVLALAAAPTAAAQSLTRANGHPLECISCHGEHGTLRSSTGKLLKVSKTTPVAPSGLGVVSRNCLRCHYSAAYRTTEMTAAELAATGGAAAGHYIWDGSQLANHELGDSETPQCGTCHRVHETGLLLPTGSQQRAICTSCHRDRTSHPDAAHLTTGCSSCHAIHRASSPVAWALAPAGAPAIARSPGVPPTPLASASPRRSTGAVDRVLTGPAGGRLRRPEEAELRCIGCHSGNRRSGGARMPSDVRHSGRPVCLQCHPEAGSAWRG